MQPEGRCRIIALLTVTAPLEGGRKDYKLIMLIPGSPESIPEWSLISRRKQSLVGVVFPGTRHGAVLLTGGGVGSGGEGQSMRE